MRTFWDRKLGFPCVRVAINRYRFYGDIRNPAPQGSLLLFLSCRRRGRRFFWRYVNIETGAYDEATCEMWKPEDYLSKISMPLDDAIVEHEGITYL